MFIKNVTASELPDDYKKLRLAEARFLRAYFYHQLWMAYGGVPIIDEVLNRAEQGEEIARPRNTYDETYQFITSELAAAFTDLEQTPETSRASKGAALALKGWCELFAHKFPEAAATNKQIIDELGYDLHPDYGAFFLQRATKARKVFFTGNIFRVYRAAGLRDISAQLLQRTAQKQVGVA